MHCRLALLLVLGCTFTLVDVGDAAAAKACTKEYAPVCALKRGGERVTYPNACQARAAGAKILHTGECIGGPLCIMLYDPVCARSPGGALRTYPSLCEAENANAVFVRPGPCK